MFSTRQTFFGIIPHLEYFLSYARVLKSSLFTVKVCFFNGARRTNLGYLFFIALVCLIFLFEINLDLLSNPCEQRLGRACNRRPLELVVSNLKRLSRNTSPCRQCDQTALRLLLYGKQKHLFLELFTTQCTKVSDSFYN